MSPPPDSGARRSDHTPASRGLHVAHQVAARPDQPGLFLALAPMDGVTDASYRDVLTSQFSGHSGVSLCVSEFVRVVDRPVQSKVLLRHCPELSGDGCTASGVPVFVQLLGGDAEPMAQSAALAAGLGARGIDLNFGCPAKTVNRHDGGATLLKTPDRVESVTRAVRDVVPAAIPVTVKIRVGWDSAAPVMDLARASEQGGATWLTIHGRTRAQLYRPPVDWEAIGRAAACVRMPVVANGDLFSPEALHRCSEVSGCQSFMIGRGAMGRPDLFAATRGWRTEPLGSPEIARLLLDYVAHMRGRQMPSFNALGRLKQWLRMGALQREDLAAWFERYKRERELVEVTAAIAAHCRVHATREPATYLGNARAH